MNNPDDNAASDDESNVNSHKVEDYIEKLYSQGMSAYYLVIERLTRICVIAESDEFNKESIVKELSKRINKFEVALEKLAKIIKSGNAKSFSDSTLPAGLIKWVDESKNPLQWIQAVAIDKRNSECDKLRTASCGIQGFKESLLSELENIDLKHKLDIN